MTVFDLLPDNFLDLLEQYRKIPDSEKKEYLVKNNIPTSLYLMFEGKCGEKMYKLCCVKKDMLKASLVKFREVHQSLVRNRNKILKYMEELDNFFSEYYMIGTNDDLHNCIKTHKKIYADIDVNVHTFNKIKRKSELPQGAVFEDDLWLSDSE